MTHTIEAPTITAKRRVITPLCGSATFAGGVFGDTAVVGEGSRAARERRACSKSSGCTGSDSGGYDDGPNERIAAASGVSTLAGGLPGESAFSAGRAGTPRA